MREERGTIAGDWVVSDAVELRGSVGGNVTVAEGGKLYMRGAVYGDILVEYGGDVSYTIPRSVDDLRKLR